MDWLNWVAVGPVREKLRCWVFGGSSEKSSFEPALKGSL